jgi:hypothetical protein
MSAHRPFLMGSETEYAVSGRNGTSWIDPDDVHELLVGALQRRRATAEDDGGYRGLFLQHGGRLYLDYGSHPEHCTPECRTPREVAAYDKAGEHLLDLARRAVEAERPEVHLTVLKNNLDPVQPDDVSYGTHESYTCWVPSDEAAPALMAHLVSRVLYAGAGGLTAHPEGVGFELSQRARHLVEPVGDDTTSCRAIFSTRVRNDYDLSPAGWTRVHLIGKDSQRAPLGIYLTFATTGLLIEMLNRGHRVGQGLVLQDPVGALRALSRDPWGRTAVALEDGRHLTALQIQSIYLEECERALQGGDLPDWAPEALGHWRQTLADLERDPLRLADRLDPYCKLLIYEHELLRANLDWDDLRKALAGVRELRDHHADEVVTALLAEDPGKLSEEQKADYAAAFERAGAGRAGALDRLRFAVRLQALDVHYHELGGFYDRLRAAGRVRDVVLGPGEVERASLEPPSGGRAQVRGSWIRDHHEPGWRADWQYLWHPPTGRCLDLRDPFSGELRLAQLPPAQSDDQVYRTDVMGLLRRPA